MDLLHPKSSSECHSLRFPNIITCLYTLQTEEGHESVHNRFSFSVLNPPPKKKKKWWRYRAAHHVKFLGEYSVHLYAYSMRSLYAKPLDCVSSYHCNTSGGAIVLSLSLLFIRGRDRFSRSC